MLHAFDLDENIVSAVVYNGHTGTSTPYTITQCTRPFHRTQQIIQIIIK